MSRRSALIAALALGACTTTISLGEGDPRIYPDGGARIRCGDIDCQPGKICCNASCGTCAAAGACGTVPRTCTDASVGCAPDHVSLSGSLVCSHFVWNGIDCMEILGCTCNGDCASIATSYVSCMQQHASCWSSHCDASSFCPIGYACARDSCELGTTGTCTPIPTDCTSALRSATCGCDQIVYHSQCDAVRAGQSISSIPACGACNPPSLTITTGCSTSLGWAWTGTGCVEHTGCTCTGQCDWLAPTESECIARYESACRSLFTCGAISCRRGAEVCEQTTMGAECVPTPSTCTPPGCACLVAAGLATADHCGDDGAGGVTIATP